MIRAFRTHKTLRLENAVLRKDNDALRDRYNLLLGRQLSFPPAPTLADLGRLWAAAEQMGKVEVDIGRDYQRNESYYEVKISFESRKGSKIAAKGKGDIIVAAFEAAIMEARALLAGVAFADA